MVNKSRAGLLVKKINLFLLLLIIRGLMNNSLYQVLPLEKNCFNKQKKRPHISVAGWWGTLFLNQILKKCNPLSVALLMGSSYTTDSALIIFLNGN